MGNSQLEDVVDLSRVLCEHPIKCTLAYATKDNFLGRIVDGYHPEAKNLALITPAAAKALCAVQNELLAKGLGLFIFDAYRPLRAVADFCLWMNSPVQDEYELARKAIHYPHITKKQLATLGYVADTVSDHCYGDTVDLSLINVHDGQLLDMGVCFDFFDELAHLNVSVEQIGHAAKTNRLLLLEVMEQAGFNPHPSEYWHFTYHERQIKTPMDFEIISNW